MSPIFTNKDFQFSDEAFQFLEVPSKCTFRRCSNY